MRMWSFIVGVGLVLLFAETLLAGTTGKISGTARDATTGEGLVALNVVVKDTRWGAATDSEGHYFILNVPPGEYSVVASMLGYETQVTTNVVVSADRTTVVDFSLSEETLEVEEIVVVAERPLIQKDETARGVTIASETFTEMPVRRFEEVLTTQAGFTTDEDGEIHVRGGRTGEVAYMIDGIYVRDPYSGGFGSQLDKYTIQELQVLTGAYSAEYGQAMSGVINIVTKEGGHNYHGRFEYESDRINQSSLYRRVDWLLETDIVEGLTEEERLLFRDMPPLDSLQYQEPDFGQKGTPEYIPISGAFTANLSGPIPFVRNLSFFVSGRYENDKGYLPFGYDKRREVNLKLTYVFSPLKLNVFLQSNRRNWKPYSHRWKYHPAGYEDRASDVDRVGVFVTHTVNNSTFYDARVSYFERRFDRFLPGKSAKFDANNVIIPSLSNFQRRRGNSDGFYFEGDNGTIDDRDIVTYTGRFDLTSQLNRGNLLKAGVELLQHRISRETFILPWEGEHHRYENFTREPFELSLYVQDKLEHEHFVLNVGLRYDYIDPKHSMWPDLDVPGFIDENGEWVASEEITVDPTTQLSPRVGIGFSVTERTMFYSSYGHFFQTPSFLEMYGPHKVDEDRPLIGNPAIRPQKTVAFEAGVRQQIGDDYVLDLNLYFKDISNLAGSTYHGFFPFEYTIYDNSDYANVNGVDVSLTKRFSNYFGVNINYSYSVAKGNESDPREGFNDYKRANFPLRPKRLFFLDFDRRHDFAFNLNVILPERFGPRIIDTWPLGDFQFNILFQAASGLPYTPGGGGEDFLIPKNSAHQPAIYNLDVKILKRVKIGRLSWYPFVVITNVLNRRNPITVWDTSGLPWDDGPATSRTKDRIFDPERVSQPRRVSLGLRMDF